MDWLRTSQELAECGEFAVAVGRVSDSQHHVGAYYRTDGGVRFVHLAWHRDLRTDDDPKPRYRWITPAALDPSVLAWLGALCRAIHENRPAIPYGFGQDQFRLVDGLFVRDETSHGLTCATFVLAMFSGYGLPLIDLSKWPRRSEDELWQRQIVEALRNSGEEDIRCHIAVIQADVGNCVRVRPEEVAAAASVDSLPVPFDQAAAKGELVANELTASWLYSLLAAVGQRYGIVAKTRLRKMVEVAMASRSGLDRIGKKLTALIQSHRR